jgi:hypothetical protein
MKRGVTGAVLVWFEVHPRYYVILPDRSVRQQSQPLSFSSSYFFEMGPPTDRKAILEKLRKSIKDGNIIVGAGAGIGLSAKFIEQGGGDMIIIYNSGRFRMAGRGSLAGLMPYGNANDVVLDMVSNSFLSSSCNIRSNPT